MNPFQGLKLVLLQTLLELLHCHKRHESLSGIETHQLEDKTSPVYRHKRHESLSGIETFFTKSAISAVTASSQTT